MVYYYDTSLLVIISTFQSDYLIYVFIITSYNTYTNHRMQSCLPVASLSWQSW